MKQQAFEDKHSPQWQTLETLLEALEKSKKGEKQPEGMTEFPALYRVACHHLALAKDRQYSPHLVQQLNQLVLRGHQQLYHRKMPLVSQAVRFFMHDFPAALRKEYRLFWLSVALFLLPGLILGWLCYTNPDMIYAVHSPSGVAEMESMYDPENAHIGRERQSDSDFYMFGYYIMNNIGIGFRTYASGLLYGIGTVFILISNGVFIGAVAGHLTQLGYTTTFWGFVSSHGPFELTAIVICGMAGLQLARALSTPGRLGRAAALKKEARASIPLVIGAGLMLFMAAFIEAFWSSSTTIAAPVKYATGALLWLLVIIYFRYAGRGGDGTR